MAKEDSEPPDNLLEHALYVRGFLVRRVSRRKEYSFGDFKRDLEKQNPRAREVLDDVTLHFSDIVFKDVRTVLRGTETYFVYAG